MALLFFAFQKLPAHIACFLSAKYNLLRYCTASHIPVPNPVGGVVPQFSLVKPFYWKWFLAVCGQIPVSQQIFVMNFDPCDIQFFNTLAICMKHKFVF